MYPVTCICFAPPYNRQRRFGIPFTCSPQRSKVAFSNWIHPLSGHRPRSGWKHAKVDKQLGTWRYVNPNEEAKPESRVGTAIRISNAIYRDGQQRNIGSELRSETQWLIVLKFHLTLHYVGYSNWKHILSITSQILLFISFSRER
jgi:beta-glucanase (GH16 family)